MVTQKTPAGTVAALGVKPGVVDENSVVGAAPAGPETTTSASVPSNAAAVAPVPAHTRRIVKAGLPLLTRPAITPPPAL
jgi:hypothetical protein